MLSATKLRVLRRLRDFLGQPEGASASYVSQVCEHANSSKVQTDLVVECILSISPDGLRYKWTDYGVALYKETEALQQAWVEAPVISIEDSGKDQVVIRQGEVFRGKFYILQLFKRAKAQLQIQDSYCSHELFAWLYGTPASTTTEILTSPKSPAQDKSFATVYQAYRQERPRSEVRLIDAFHDRKIIIDNSEAFQVGESLKDVGKKGTTITRLREVQGHLQEFKRLWNLAKPL